MSAFSKFMKLLSLAGGVRATNNPLTGGSRIYADGTEILSGVGVTRAARAPTPLFGESIQLSDVVLYSGTPALSVVTGPNGRQALKIVCNTSENTEIQIAALAGATFSGEAYMLTDASYSKGVSQCLFYSSPDANRYTNYVGAGYGGYNGPLNTPLEPTDDANTLRIDKTQFALTGTISYPFVSNWNSFRIIPRAGMAPTVYLYGIGFAPQPKSGRVIISVDDGYDSWFRLGQPIMDDRNIPVTMAVIPSSMDQRGGAAYIRQLKGLVNRGGAVVAHGPNVGGGAGSLFSAFPDTFSRISDMVSVRQWISDQGLATIGYDHCYVWPQGAWQTGTSSDKSLLDAALAVGFTTGRAATAATVGVYSNYDSLSKYQHLTVPNIGHGFAGTTALEVTNITTIVAAINNAATFGSDVTLMLHRVQPTTTADGAMSSIGIRVSDLTTIADAIATQVTAGKLTATTLPAMAVSRAGNFWQQ